MQKIASHTAHNLPKRRAKAPLEISLTGHVGELVAAEFAKQRMQIDRLEAKLESYEKLFGLIVEQTRFPIRTYTEDDFTTLFGVQKRTQQNYRKAGKLDYFKPGEKVLYTQQHIDDFIARHDTRNLKKG